MVAGGGWAGKVPICNSKHDKKMTEKLTSSTLLFVRKKALKT